MPQDSRAFGELTRLIASASESPEVLDAISTAAATMLGAKMARVWVDDPEARVLRAQGNYSRDPGARPLMAEASVIPYEKGLTSRIFQSREPEYVQDVQQDPRWQNERLAKEVDLHAFAGLPLIVGDRVLGVLAVLFGDARAFTPEEMELMSLLADHAAMALRNARGHEESERRRKAAEALAEVGGLLARSLDVEEVGQRIVDSVRRLFGVDYSILSRLEEGSGDLVIVAGSGESSVPLPPGLVFPRGTAAIGLAVREGRPVASPDVLSDPRITLTSEIRGRIERAGYGAVLAVPLLVQGRAIGALGLGDRKGRAFTDEEVRLAQAFADQAALALENARLFAEAERRRKAAEALAEVGRVLSQSLDPETVGQLVVDGILPLIGAVSAFLFLVEPVSRVRLLVAVSGEVGPGLARNTVYPAETGATGLALRERRPVVTVDLLNDPRITLTPEDQARIEQAPHRAVLAVPLLVRDRAIGALAVGDRAGRVFTDEEIRLAEAFADRAAWALEGARLHKEVRDARDFLQSIAENSADAIFATDPHGRITYASPGAVEIFGYSPEEGLGRSVADFYRGGLEEARAVMARLRAEERIRDYETRIRAKDGRWVEVNASFSLLRDPGGAIVGTVGVMKDVTERKRLEENFRQSQKLEAIGRLAGGIAHDFNNLMTIIKGRSQLLLESLRPEDPMRRDVELFHKTAGRAAQLTQQLLAFGRKQVLQPKVLDLNEVVAGLESMLGRLIGEDIDLVTAPDPGLGRVRADPGQLEQVIVNLAVNARDAMPNGGKLTLETANVALDEGYASQHVGVQPGPYVVLAVSDTGVGMDEPTRARIFEPFFTTKERGQGTGLGLATVYGIVKQSGGNIWCYSEPGRGTTFKVYLPRVESGVESPAPESAPPAPRRGGETVLLVEDEEELRSVAREMLEMYGYTVLEAGHPEEAVRIAERHTGPIHLLLTDVVMPGMSGRELAERLASLRAGLPALYISGYTDDAIVHHGVLDPGTAFLEKPFTPDDLARKVREVLDRA